MNSFTLTRRQSLTGTAAVGAGLFLPIPPGARAAVLEGGVLPYDTPAENVRSMARMTSTLEAGRTGYVRYRGKAFALMDDGRNLPLYDIDGIGALKAVPQPGGAIRFLFNEFALYLDPAAGRPLERWTNPITNRDVPVWHLRNGPVNYALDPAKASFGAFARADGHKVDGFQLPWVRRGPFATFAMDVVSTRPNPLDPATWPLESSGPTVSATEHSQYAALERDLLNKRLLSIPFFASLQSVKPWHPWMLMGQRPGRVFTRTVAERVPGPDVLPAASLAFARANLAPWMEAPSSWTGEYVTQQAIYKKEREPAR